MPPARCCRTRRSLSVISEAFPQEFAFMVDDAMFEGTGAAQPLGFMNAGCKVTIAKETGQAADHRLREHHKMWARCPRLNGDAPSGGSIRTASRSFASLSLVIGTGGVPVYLPPGGLSGSPYGTLMGRPVVPIEFCSTLGTEGDIVLVDPDQYVMIDKGDIQYATSIHVAFLTDEQAFRFIYRVDGQPVDDKPITPFKGTAQAVALRHPGDPRLRALSGPLAPRARRLPFRPLSTSQEGSHVGQADFRQPPHRQGPRPGRRCLRQHRLFRCRAHGGIRCLPVHRATRVSARPAPRRSPSKPATTPPATTRRDPLQVPGTPAATICPAP
jgi:hypothetical protein